MKQLRDRGTKIILDPDYGYLNNSKHKTVLAQCPACKKILTPERASLKRTGHTFCKGCAKLIDLKGQRFGRLLVISYSHKVKRPGSGYRHFWNCQCDCGNTKKVQGQPLRGGMIVSCGCYHQEIINTFKGENHPSYNPNLTDEERDQNRNGRNTSNSRYVKWRIAVYERDNYTCQVCYEWGGRLIAHHLDNWKHHKDLRFKVSNGVTLCESCHKSFHHHYGIRNNTREQFHLWLSEIESIP